MARQKLVTYMDNVEQASAKALGVPLSPIRRQALRRSQEQLLKSARQEARDIAPLNVDESLQPLIRSGLTKEQIGIFVQRDVLTDNPEIKKRILSHLRLDDMLPPMAK